MTCHLPEQIRGLHFDPDVVFFQIQHDEIQKEPVSHVLNNSIIKLQEAGAFVINWTGDIRNTVPRWMYGFKADLTCFSNWRDVHTFKGKSDFLNIGIDPVAFNKYHNEEVGFRKFKTLEEGTHDVVFMGNDFGHFPLSSYRKQVVSKLHNKYGIKFGLYGNGYQNSRKQLNAVADNPYDMQQAESWVYNKAKIAISVSHYDVDGYFSDRLLRCLGSNVCVLSHNYQGIERDFEPGKHLVTFDNVHDLIQKCDYYLAHDNERETIAAAGYDFVHKNYTYKNMAENIVKLYKTHSS